VLAACLPDALSIHDVAGRFVGANEEALALLDRPWSEIVGRKVFDFIHPDDRGAVIQAAEAQAGGVVWFEPHRIVRPDGAQVWIEVRLRPFEDDRYLAVLRDVTERVRAYEALEASERRHRALVDAAPLGIAIFQDGRVVYANEALGRILGRDPATLPAMPPVQVVRLVHPDDRALVFDRVKQRLAGSPTAPVQYGFRVLRPDGAVRHVEVYSARITYRGRPASQTLCVDVTARVHAQRQLVHAQKMEAVGRLAGGIAHDFNNLLTVILNETDALRSACPDDAPTKEALDAIADAGRRASELTRQLLGFARKQVRRREDVVLDDAVAALAPLLRRMVGRHVRLETRLAAGDAAICADPAEIEQILVNLVLNARDAMETGTVRLETSVVDRPGGRLVRVAVEDDGPGMAPEVLARCFEPFFTTRETSGGTGLGLATCYAIVDDLGGRIDVRSKPGEGTRFEIVVPAEDGSEGPRAVPRRHADRASVLLVEDDASVRRALELALEAAGFSVEAVGSAEAAHSAWQRHGGFAAVVSDIMLPGENGLSLARRLHEDAPGTVVVLASGYAADPTVRTAIEEAPFPFFAKPFLARDLIAHLREAVGTPAAPPGST